LLDAIKNPALSDEERDLFVGVVALMEQWQVVYSSERKAVDAMKIALVEKQFSVPSQPASILGDNFLTNFLSRED